jgi:hypothetical protein
VGKAVHQLPVEIGDIAFVAGAHGSAGCGGSRFGEGNCRRLVGVRP